MSMGGWEGDESVEVEQIMEEPTWMKSYHFQNIWLKTRLSIGFHQADCTSAIGRGDADSQPSGQ